MLTTSLLLLAAAAPQGGSSTAPVVINELSYDDAGANDRVFVELYNRTTGSVDISGWTLEGVDGTAATPSNGTVVIPPGTVLAAGGFYVIGQALGVPNVDLDVPTMNAILETGPDGLVLRDAALADVDGVTWEQFGWTNPLPTWLEGDGLQGDIYNNDANPQSAARVFDGYDDDDNGTDFRVMAWSPGTSNQAANTAPPLYVNDFDDAVGSTVAAAFTYSFVPGTTEDPVTLGIPASPQGGNCSIWYDPSGGGDANYLNAVSRRDWIVECYAFLRGPEATFDPDDIEGWGLGVRGTTDSFGEFPDINGLHAFSGSTTAIQAGITGIAWYQVISQTASDLYLVDFNDGGTDFTILAGPIAIATSGWVRLRLSVIGGDVVGNFGGTFGCDDGTRYTATGVTTFASGVFVQYRENVSLAGAHRPPVLDALRIAPNSAASTSLVGAGSPTTVGTPVIGASGLPTVGNLGFAVTGTGLVPGSVSFTLLTIDVPTLPGTQITGAPAGALYFLTPPAFAVFHSNGAGGTSTTAIPIPCDTTMSDLPLGAQIFDVDPALAAAVQFGTSPALAIVVGN